MCVYIYVNMYMCMYVLGAGGQGSQCPHHEVQYDI